MQSEAALPRVTLYICLKLIEGADGFCRHICLQSSLLNKQIIFILHIYPC